MKIYFVRQMETIRIYEDLIEKYFMVLVFVVLVWKLQASYDMIFEIIHSFTIYLVYN